MSDNVTGRQGDGVDRSNSFNLPANFGRPAREGQRNIPSPGIRHRWDPAAPIATIPSVLGIISGPSRTLLPQIVRIGPADPEIVAIDGAAVHEALERAGRRPELEKFFQEGVFGVRGAILRRLGVTG